jgi:DNA-binding LacI/PurR family transcriptional regulator
MKKVDLIAAKIQEIIYREKLQKGAPLPSANKIARDFNVSYVTAYKAVSKLVENNSVYRIDGKGTFVRGNQGKAKTIGILWREPNDIEAARNSFIFKGILLGLNMKAGEKRMNVRNIFLNDNIDDDFREVDCLVSSPGIWEEKNKASILKKITCPHLCLSLRIPPVSFCNNLCVDMHGMFKQAIEYLNSLGYRNIGFIDHRNDRKDIFIETKKILGAPYPEKWIIKASGFDGFQGATEKGKELAEEIFEKYPDMEAAVSISDHVAFGVYQKTRQMKKRFAVIGTDNVEGSGFMSPFGEPVLTCSAPSYSDIGERAVEVLENLGTNPNGEFFDLHVQAKLVKRKSCGE